MPGRYGETKTAAGGEGPVSLAEAKDHLRISHEDENDDLQAKIDAAERFVELHSNLALKQTTWQLRFDRFPPGSRLMYLPRPPLVSVDQIDYVAASDGSTTTLDDAAIAAGYIVLTDEQPGLICPAYGEVWPEARRQPGAVLYTVTAGFEKDIDAARGQAGDFDLVRAAILLVLGHLYETREETLEQALRRVPLGAVEFCQALRPDHLLRYDPERMPLRR